ncbi:MAG: hypothetical protein V1750_08260, partial [Acidobacteriota bacterium]
MAEIARGVPAERRLAELRRYRREAAISRLSRHAADPLWQRVRTLTPALFLCAGERRVHRLRSDWGEVTRALRDDAVFTLDTACRLAHDRGLFQALDVHAYLRSQEAVDRLVAARMLDPTALAGQSLLPLLPAPPRLWAVVVGEWPPWRQLADRWRVVSDERLAQDLLGAVGVRLDLFARLWSTVPPLATARLA